MVDFEILAYTDAHRNECCRIVEENYDVTMAVTLRADLTRNSRAYTSRFRVVVKDGVMLGFGCYAPSRMESGIYEITWVNVDPNFQGHGIGTILMTRLIDEIKSRHGRAILLFSEASSLTLYERLGFQRLYLLDQDWLMILHLGDNIPLLLTAQEIDLDHPHDTESIFERPDVGSDGETGDRLAQPCRLLPAQGRYSTTRPHAKPRVQEQGCADRGDEEHG